MSGNIGTSPHGRTEVCTVPPEIVDIQVERRNGRGNRVRCGDQVTVAMPLSGFGFDGAIVVVFKTRGGQQVDTHVEPAGGRLVPTFEWTAKKPDDDWTDAVDIRVEASLFDREAHQLSTYDGHGDLHIVRAADEAMTRCIPGARRHAAKWVQDDSGTWILQGNAVYSWAANYYVAFANGAITITGRVKLVGVGGLTITSQMKSAWKQEIEGYWNNRFRAHRRSCGRGRRCDCAHHCCKYDIRVVCNFVDRNELTTVEVHPGAASGPWGSPNWWYSGKWWQNKSNNVPAAVRAHEFGHNIGLFDEYRAGALRPGIDPNSWSPPSNSIMNNGSAPLPRHFGRWLHSAGSMLNERFHTIRA